MKKRIIAMALFVMLLLSALSGCVENTPASEQNAPPKPNVEGNVEGNVEVDVEANAAAQQAYMAFLKGEGKATTAESFRADDAEYNYDGLLFGEYSIGEMKSAIEELEMIGNEVKYTFLDFGQDGVDELVLRFESVEPGFVNWTGILRYNGSGIDINYYYEDGYRSYADLYTSGWLRSGGSMGAGASICTITGFDGKGVGSELFSVKDYYGLFAEGIGYDLSDDWNFINDGLSEEYNSEEFFIQEYVDANGIKLAVRGWSEDAELLAMEEAFVDRLIEVGAEFIAPEEMDIIADLTPYEGETVTWQSL